MRIHAFQPVFFTGAAITHICLSLCEGMRGDGVEVRLTSPAGVPLEKPFLRYAVPRPVASAMYRVGFSSRSLSGIGARSFVSSLDPAEVVYLWPGSPEWVYEKAKARGHAIVMERINCHRSTSRRILDEAYRRAGLPPAHGLTGDHAACESRKLALADFVFSPAPNVERSLLDAGVPAGKILRASYGWDPARVRTADPIVPRGDGTSFLFLGRICIRKGAHLLLEAWSRSGVRGKLILAGSLDDDIAHLCAAHLARPDVTILPHSPDIAPILASADVFAFPTLEEGSPLVVYEALASGLPVVTTTMGAGEVVRPGVEGLVLDAYDTDAWVATIRALADDPERVRTLGAAAAVRARDFTWERAGRRRRALLRDAVGALVRR